MIRGGAFKPRSSPYAFQGMGEEGLKLLREAADRNGLLVVSEVMDQTQIPLVAQYADILQVGARNMQNFNLLRELGKQRKPVLLKRGISATIEELLLSAEYILSGGNYDVILCERGIRTFETYTRNTMDISAIPVVKKLSHLPIVADPSHGTGRRDKVVPMARAAVAAGADGLLVEVHPDPDHALSDGAQSLRPEQFEEMMRQLRHHRAGGGEDASDRSGRHRRHRADRRVLRAGAARGRVRRRNSGREFARAPARERMAAGAIDRAACRWPRPWGRPTWCFSRRPSAGFSIRCGIWIPLVRPGALVTDAGSTKCEIVDVARQNMRALPVSGRPSHGRQGDPRGGGGRGRAVPRPHLGADARMSRRSWKRPPRAISAAGWSASARASWCWIARARPHGGAVLRTCRNWRPPLWRPRCRGLSAGWRFAGLGLGAT